MKEKEIKELKKAGYDIKELEQKSHEQIMTVSSYQGPTRYTWKLLIASGILVIIGILTPSCYLPNGGELFMWYFGFWVIWYDGPYGMEIDSGGPRDFFVPDYADKYIGLATGVIIILIISAILMFVSSKNAKYGKNNKVALGTSAIGTILAFVGPGVYYDYLNREFTNFWVIFDQGIGYYLPIIAGILGFIAISFNIYAVTLESKAGEGQVIEKYQPPPDTQVDVQVQQEGLKFCPNCGAKLTGPFCQECDTKVS